MGLERAARASTNLTHVPSLLHHYFTAVHVVVNRLYGSMEYEEDGIVSESCDDSVYLYEEEGFPAQLLSALNDMRQQVGRRKFSAIAV